MALLKEPHAQTACLDALCCLTALLSEVRNAACRRPDRRIKT